MLTGVAAARRSLTGPVGYTSLLALVLGGYLFFGRPFAYLHIPSTPVFVGEVALGAGFLVALRHSALLQTARRSPPLEALLLLITLGTARLAVDLPSYGLVAVRDAALWYYSLLAFVIAALLIQYPSLLDRLVGWYAAVLPWFLAWAGAAVLLSRRFGLEGPVIPGTDVPLLGFKAGDLAVHVAIGLSFLWLGLDEGRLTTRGRLLATAAGVMSLLIAGTTNRGGFVAATMIIGGTLLVADRRRTLAAATAGVLMLLLALAGVTDFRVDVEGREVSLQQLAENIGTLAGGAGSVEGSQQGTVRWRLDYWGEIAEDTLARRNGVLGLGFGPNLADHYGYQVAPDETDQRLRNAHNSHMTLAARLGLPGVAVWFLVWAVWLKVVLAVRGRADPDSPKRQLASWLVLAVLGVLANAVFDPILEGPQMALWLWSFVGVGCALDLSLKVPSHHGLLTGNKGASSPVRHPL